MEDKLMKKLIFCFSILFGLFALTSCEESASITYVDSNGETQTVKVTATEDKGTIQAILDYSSLANYDDVTSFKLKEKMSLACSLTKDTNESLGLDSKTKLSGKADMTINLSAAEGLDVSVSGDLSFGKDYGASVSANTIYEGKLDQMFAKDNLIYVDAGYDVKSAGSSSKASIKQAYSTADIFEEIEDILEQFYPENGPSDATPDAFTVEEFYKTFTNSKMVISEVKNDVIYLEMNLALKDLLGYVDPDNEELKPLLSLDTSFIFTFGIEASTGRFREFSFRFDDVKLLNLIFLTLISEEYPDLKPLLSSELIQTFQFESKLTIEYNKAKIRKLSAAEKEKYTTALL